MPVPDPLATVAALCARSAAGESLSEAVSALAEAFQVGAHEVAVLRLEQEVLAFVAPARLRTMGTIPLSAANSSVAARTAKTGRSDLNNRFAATPHARVFEGIKLGDAKLPIQKLMSAPIARAGRILGVVQVSRKANSPDDVADFTREDLALLTRAGEMLANLLEP